MSEEELELLITLDDPGEDALEEDTFDHSQAGHTVAVVGSRSQISEQTLRTTNSTKTTGAEK